MPLFAISASDIDTHGVAIDADLPPDWIAGELSAADVTAVPRADSPSAAGHVTARLSRSGTDIVVRGRVVASVSVPCARCLRPAPVAIDAEIALLLRCVPVKPAKGKLAARKAKAKERGEADAALVPGRSSAASPADAGRGHGGAAARKKDMEYEFTADEAEIDTYDGEQVVLDGFIREAMLLELPNFPLCSEACPGIGPPPGPKAEAAGGARPVVDPRLAPLAALRDKLGSADGGAPAPVRSKTAQKPASLKASHSKTPKKKNVGASLGAADRDSGARKKKE